MKNEEVRESKAGKPVLAVAGAVLAAYLLLPQFLLFTPVCLHIRGLRKNIFRPSLP
ncbi:MAG: hypothetical protein LUD81_10940 [Clostridiales bacterium]|nr:hypothetical protein [Clostridiales bacterium]